MVYCTDLTLKPSVPRLAKENPIGSRGGLILLLRPESQPLIQISSFVELAVPNSEYFLSFQEKVVRALSCCMSDTMG